MRAVLLCKRLRDATRLDNRLQYVTGLERVLFITRTRSLPLFLVSLALDWLRLGAGDWLDVCFKLARGHLRISTMRIGDERVIERLRRLDPDVGLHATPVLYPRDLIECFRLGILNAHIGLLPQYRGRCVMEWTVLHGDETGITTFFIDEGIDTGPRIVFRKKIDISSFRDVASAKAYLFSLDGKMYARALELLQRADFAPTRQGISEGKRFYVMSELLTGVVERILNSPDEGGAGRITQPKEQPAALSR